MSDLGKDLFKLGCAINRAMAIAVQQDGQSAGASCRQQQKATTDRPADDGLDATEAENDRIALPGIVAPPDPDAVLHISGAAQAEASVPRPNHHLCQTVEGSGPRPTMANPASGGLQELSAKFETWRGNATAAEGMDERGTRRSQATGPWESRGDPSRKSEIVEVVTVAHGTRPEPSRFRHDLIVYDDDRVGYSFYCEAFVDRVVSALGAENLADAEWAAKVLNRFGHLVRHRSETR